MEKFKSFGDFFRKIPFDLPIKANVSITGKSSNGKRVVNKFIPVKKADPGMFAIDYWYNSCVIPFTSLYDTEASVNVMPITFARKLGLANVMKSPTRTIQLVDQ